MVGRLQSIVIVTGGATGIGRAVAVAVAEFGRLIGAPPEGGARWPSTERHWPGVEPR
jgi:hypothetical protein